MTSPQRSRGSVDPNVSTDTVGNILLLLLTVADTTWRIFTPIILFVGAGLWVDLSYGTKPWLTLAGVVVGFSIAALLVWAQIKKVQR